MIQLISYLISGASPSSAFIYIGAGAQLPPDAKKPKFLKAQPAAGGDGPIVTFEGSQQGMTPVESVEMEYKGDGEQRTSPTRSVYLTVTVFFEH